MSGPQSVSPALTIVWYCVAPVVAPAVSAPSLPVLPLPRFYCPSANEGKSHGHDLRSSPTKSSPTHCHSNNQWHLLYRISAHLLLQSIFIEKGEIAFSSTGSENVYEWKHTEKQKNTSEMKPIVEHTINRLHRKNWEIKISWCVYLLCASLDQVGRKHISETHMYTHTISYDR